MFQCTTTFEREITLHGTLKMLEVATREIGAPRIADYLNALHAQVVNGGDMPDLTDAQDRVLRTAKRFGKGRFAQVTSKHVKSATEIPDYIQRAMNWLME